MKQSHPKQTRNKMESIHLSLGLGSGSQNETQTKSYITQDVFLAISIQKIKPTVLQWLKPIGMYLSDDQKAGDRRQGVLLNDVIKGPGLCYLSTPPYLEKGWGFVWGEGSQHQPHLSLYYERKAFPETSQETSAYVTLARAHTGHMATPNWKGGRKKRFSISSLSSGELGMEKRLRNGFQACHISTIATLFLVQTLKKYLILCITHKNMGNV